MHFFIHLSRGARGGAQVAAPTASTGIMSASKKRASARAESAPGIDDPPGVHPVLLLGARARRPPHPPAPFNNGPDTTSRFFALFRGCHPPAGTTAGNARRRLARAFAPRARVRPRALRRPRVTRAQPAPAPPAPRPSTNIFFHRTDASRATVTHPASSRPTPSRPRRPSPPRLRPSPRRSRSFPLSSITAGLFAAFVSANGRLREWYESLAPAVISDVIPDDDFSAFPFPSDPAPPGASALSSDDDLLESARVACVVFVVALVFNLNAAVWSARRSRRRLNLQVAYISAVAAFTHLEIWRGDDWYVSVPASRGATSFSALRVLEWIFTTPVLLLLVQHLHECAFAAAERAPGARRKSSSTGYVRPSKLALVAADELMILCGVAMPLCGTAFEYASVLTVSMCSFAYVVTHSVLALADIVSRVEMESTDSTRLACIAALKVVAWSAYPAVYLLADAGLVTVKRQHEFYLYNDVLTKFSYTLMLSAGSLRFLDLLEEHRERAALEMSRAQRAFFFNITHELRTPLNSIIGFNTLAVETGELTEFTGSFIKASLTSAEALLGLINQILDFAKFEGAKDGGGGGIELSSDVFTVRQLIEQVTDMTQKASSRGVDLVVVVRDPDRFNTRFVGDFFRLRQCCVNLVDNAVKYSSNVQGRDALVEFSIGVVEGDRGRCAMTFEIKDNGVGIPAAKQRSLFVPFCQPADHKHAREKGTGLGLVITKSIVECMGGRIDFESVEDEGTRFFFTVDFNLARREKKNRTSERRDDRAFRPDEDADADAPFADFDDEGSGWCSADTLPPDAKLIFHPSVGARVRRHVSSILRCFRARPGAQYVVVADGGDVASKVARAATLGHPILLVDVAAIAPDEAAALIDAHPRAGLILFGQPYQLIDARARLGARRDVAAALKPVKPSDLLDAVTRLVNEPRRRAGDGVPGLGSGVGTETRGTMIRARDDPRNGTPPASIGDTVRASGFGSGFGSGSGSGSAVSEFADDADADAGVGFGTGTGVFGVTPAVLDVRLETGTDARDASSSFAGGDASLAGMRVLLAEDNAMNQQMARFSIVKCGASLDIASHGGQAVELIRRRLEAGEPTYDCVLMDMMMPVLDGAAATRRIRELERKHGRESSPHVIVGLSANVGPEYTARVKAAGMDGSLSKPFYPATLRATLSSVRRGAYLGFAARRTEGEGVEGHQGKPGN